MYLKSVSPSESLIPYIDKYTMFSNIGEKGCIMSDKFIPSVGEALVFHFRDKSLAYINGKSVCLPEVIFIGQQTRSLYIEPGQEFDTLIVKFKPLAFFRLFHVSFNKISDRYLDARLLPGKDLTLLYEQMITTRKLEQRISLLEEFFIACLGKNTCQPRHSEAIKYSVNTIMHTCGNLRLSEISRRACIDERTFRRHFSQQVGISAKSFSRLVKFSHIVQDMLRYPMSREIDLAYKYNFFDQTHFINDFKDIMGETPQSFLKRDTSNGKLLSALQEEVKE